MKYNKGFAPLVIVAIVVGVLAVGSGAYLLGKNQNNLSKDSVKNDVIDSEVPEKELGCKLGYERYISTSYNFSICYKSGIKPFNVSNKNKGYNDGIAFMKDQVFLDTIFISSSTSVDLHNDKSVVFISDISFGDVVYDKFEEKNYNQKSYKYTYFKIKNPYSNSNLIIDIINPYYPDQPKFLDLSTLLFNEGSKNNEDSSSEIFNNQPGVIKSVKSEGHNRWILEVDLLSHNPKWLPGVDSTGEFFINQNKKIRNLKVDEKTKTFECGLGLDDNSTSADVLIDTSNYIYKIQSNEYKNRYFDINGSDIIAIYEQCLP